MMLISVTSTLVVVEGLALKHAATFRSIGLNLSTLKQARQRAKQVVLAVRAKSQLSHLGLQAPAPAPVRSCMING